MTDAGPGRAAFTAPAKVVGSLALAIFAVGCLIGNIFTVVFYSTGNEELWPVPAAVGFGLGFVVLAPLSYALVRRTSRAMVAFVENSPFEGLETVTGSLPSYPAPAPAQDVVSALLRLNELELPYEVRAESARGRTEITVEWRSEELRWRTVLQRGAVVLRWRLQVQLLEAAGTYSFTEVRTESTVQGSLPGASLSGSKQWHRGKSFNAGHFASVWAVGQVDSPDGVGNTGSVRLRPSDAKIPVFRILRAYGWRPRRDSDLLRLWEY